MYDQGTFSELINTVIRGLLIPLVPVVTAYLIAFLRRLTEDIKSQSKEVEFQRYSNIAENVIKTVSAAVDQKYISEILKKKTTLTENDLEFAFNMIKEISEEIISDKTMAELAKKYVNFDKWFENTILYNSNPEMMKGVQSSEQKRMEVMP